MSWVMQLLFSFCLLSWRKWTLKILSTFLGTVSWGEVVGELISSRGSEGTLPRGSVNSFLLFSEFDNLYWVQIVINKALLITSLTEYIQELFYSMVWGVFKPNFRAMCGNFSTVVKFKKFSHWGTSQKFKKFSHWGTSTSFRSHGRFLSSSLVFFFGEFNWETKKHYIFYLNVMRFKKMDPFICA